MPAVVTGEQQPREPMLSYAQNAEDVVLERVFADIERGFYVDVGASRPVEDSVTHHFYERGWRGVNVEPDPVEYGELVTARPDDTNVNAAVGSGDGPVLYYPGLVRGHGTLDAAVADGRGSGDPFEVEQLSLDRIFAEHAPPGGVEFLKVDVEGTEADVLASLDWQRRRPRVVVVEAVDAGGAPTHEAWEPRLTAARYRHGLFDGVNRFYCRDEDAGVLLPRMTAPANVLDNWRPAREAAAQDSLHSQLELMHERFAEVHAALEATRGALAAETAAHARTREALEQAARGAVDAERAARALLEQERARHGATRTTLEQQTAAREAIQQTLEALYASTSWRVTTPLRDASRLARMLRRGSRA